MEKCSSYKVCTDQTIYFLIYFVIYLESLPFTLLLRGLRTGHGVSTAQIDAIFKKYKRRFKLFSGFVYLVYKALAVAFVIWKVIRCLKSDLLRIKSGFTPEKSLVKSILCL